MDEPITVDQALQVSTYAIPRVRLKATLETLLSAVAVLGILLVALQT